MNLLSRKPTRVAILGCGPAGLFAAHACATAGVAFDVYSHRRKSEMYGAQYLHERIPGLGRDTSHASLSYEMRGTAEDYAKKVYGSTPVDFVSPVKFGGSSQVWDIRDAYGSAWELYARDIKDQQITTAWLMALSGSQYTRIISTIPAPLICYNTLHYFSAQPVWAIGDAPERGQFAPEFAPKQTVICDGTREIGWYRASNIFGYCTVEWPEYRKPPIPGVVEVRKPLKNTCDCWGKRVTRLGRYGAWDKSELSHQAYFKTLELLKK